MYIYTAYHLCIHSEFPLQELTIADGAPDVTVRLGQIKALADGPLNGKNNDKNRVLGELSGIGWFLIEQGHTITIEPEPGVDDLALSPNVLGPAMSVLLRQRGLLVLHASSVVVGGEAIAFLGASGWGKSTLAKAFHNQGYSVLTDDVLAIDTHPATPVVLPGFPQLKLWPDAALSLGSNNLPPLFPNASKLAFRFDQGFQLTPIPLRRIYVLARGIDHKISPLEPQTALIELVRHTRMVNVLKAPELVRAHLQQCADLVQQTSIRQFTRQLSLAAMPELIQLIEADLGIGNAIACESSPG